jgi:hypothetical protein
MDGKTESADSMRSIADDVMSPPEPQQDQQDIRNALQSYDMKPDAQAISMFTRRHLMLTVVLYVW